MVSGFSMTLRPKRARSSAPSTVFRAGGFRNGFNGKAEDRCFETTFGPRTVGAYRLGQKNAFRTLRRSILAMERCRALWLMAISRRREASNCY
jgi:hypothetical protein